jgi:hypothetical protein
MKKVAMLDLALAEGPIIRSGNEVTVETSQVIEGDFYGMGQSITLSGMAERDVYALGSTITINAPVNEDLTVAGVAVHLHGTIGDDVRVLGGEVVIAEAITDDLVVLGGRVTVLSTAKVGGDVIFFGGELILDGPVEGTVYGRGESFRIDAYVGGNVDIQGDSTITLGDRAQVAGNITYTSGIELMRAPNAVVMGTVSRGEDRPIEEVPLHRFLIINLMVIAFSGLSLFFVLRTRTEKLVHVFMEGYGRFGLTGLGMFLALPIVGTILLISGIGSIVGMAVILGYVALLLSACMFIPILFGVVFQKVFKLGQTITVFTVLLGACIVLGVCFIPVVGPLLVFVVFLMGVGMFCNELYHFFRRS